jgi:hypothetical protein
MTASLRFLRATEPSYKKYVEKKRKDGEKPLDRDAWEVKVLGKEPKGKDVLKHQKVQSLPKEVKEKLSEYKLDVVGDDVDQAIEIAKKVVEGVDKSADVCKLSPPVCKGNLGLSREKMPQIPGDMTVKEMLNAKNKDGTPDEVARAKGKAAVETGSDPDDERTILQQMLETFKSEGTSINKKKVPVGKLKATQSEIKAGKTFGMADAHLKGKFPNIGSQIVISNDGHILDGHHRWAALLTIDPSRTMDVIEVDMSMKEMLDRADELPGVYREDFQGKPLELPESIKKKKETYLNKSKKKSSTLRQVTSTASIQNICFRYFKSINARFV